MKHVLLSTLKTVCFTVLNFFLSPCIPSPNTEHHRLAQDETKSYSSSLSWPYFGLFLPLLFLPISLKPCDVSRASIIMPAPQVKKLRSGSLSQEAALGWDADLRLPVQSSLAPGAATTGGTGPPQVPESTWWQQHCAYRPASPDHLCCSTGPRSVYPGRDKVKRLTEQNTPS